MSTEIGFGIVGAGMVAQVHAEAIARTPGARLTATCRADATRAGAAAAELGVPCEASHEALLDRSDVDVDAVCLCTPSGLHPERNFVASIREGREPLVSGEEGRRSLALVLAVYEAAGLGALPDAQDPLKG